MKLIIYSLTCVLLFSCSYRTNKTKDLKSAVVLPTNSEEIKKSDIYIKDESLYDQLFITGLSTYNEPIKLVDNYIVTGKDTTYFPDKLPKDKTVLFKGEKAGKGYSLSLTRTNLTNMNYQFTLINAEGKELIGKSGKSVLGSLFFIASEMDEDTQTKEGYASYEYWDKSPGCWLSIRVGYGKDQKGSMRATLTFGCDCKDKPVLELKECPTLRSE